MVAENLVDAITREVEINLFTAMDIDNIMFTHPVIVNQTITYTATLVEVMEVCFMFLVYKVRTNNLVDIFWMGHPAIICERTQPLFSTMFINTADKFAVMTEGSLIGSVDRVIHTVGQYDVVINAFGPYGLPATFQQPLTVLAIPCSSPILTTRSEPGESMVNPLLFKRSDVNFIGTEKVKRVFIISNIL